MIESTIKYLYVYIYIFSEIKNFHPQKFTTILSGKNRDPRRYSRKFSSREIEFLSCCMAHKAYAGTNMTGKQSRLKTSLSRFEKRGRKGAVKAIDSQRSLETFELQSRKFGHDVYVVYTLFLGKDVLFIGAAIYLVIFPSLLFLRSNIVQLR